MIGIGSKLEKQTKIKIMGEKARQYNNRYAQQLDQGVEPSVAVKNLETQDYERRHYGENIDMEPYNVNDKINSLGGSVNLGYKESHKVLSETKQMYESMNQTLKMTKQGVNTGFSLTRTQEEQEDFKRIKGRIRKDHLKEDKEVDYGEPLKSDYKRHFEDDAAMKEIRDHKDKQYNQRKNDLKWYAETYIKTKASLRK